MSRRFCFQIGGQAGFGIRSAGVTLAKIASRCGYYSYAYTEYPSLIRGGHNMVQVVVGEDPVKAPTVHTDLLVALDQKSIDYHREELGDVGGVLFDSEAKIAVDDLAEGVMRFGMPLVGIAKDLGGKDIMRNTVAVAAGLALMGGELQFLLDILEETFGRKGEEIVKLNHDIARAGFEHAKKEWGTWRQVLAPREVKQTQIVLTANDSISLGALAAGVQFVSIYPMTPTSDILAKLAGYQEKMGLVVKQPEDEIAAMNMAIGAAHAGARSMVATAGGGWCLMSEAYGLAAITETPVVAIVGMRGGPATGLPTWTEQGDLQFVLHAHQGEFPRIVLAAGDVEEAFHLTMKAFNLAEKYQTPVVVLADKMILESHESVPVFDYSGYSVDRGKLVLEAEGLGGGDYRRYEVTDDGISTRTVAGSGLHFVANSDEHDETGYSEESAENRVAQMDKRMRKLEICAAQDMDDAVLYGDERARVTVVSWGSNKGAILEAMHEFEPGEVNFLHITWMSPFPAESVKRVLEKSAYVLLVEVNYTAQLGALIAEKTGIMIADRMLKYDGRPIWSEEIVEKLRFILKN